MTTIHPNSVSEPKPQELPEEYYEFRRYVSKHRMLSFYYQLAEVLALRPKNVLEIGIGPRVVCGTLQALGIPFASLDVNSELSPDFVGSVTEASTICGQEAADVVLCARVLHHVPFGEFPRALSELRATCGRYVVLTLPVDDLRVYFSMRRTAGNLRTMSLPIPRFVKRLMTKASGLHQTHYQRLWKIGSSSETGLAVIEGHLSAVFEIEKSYRLPEDGSHHLFVLRKK